MAIHCNCFFNIMFCKVYSLLLLIICTHYSEAQLFPGFYILGDSLVDNGNNNFIGSLAVADIPFNGIDYIASLPTGRFCNGRTVADLLADLVGLPPAPPFLSPLTIGPVILKGVNFASGAAGILDSTGANYINRISFNRQLQFFRKNKQSTIRLIGQTATENLLQKSLYFLVFGSNDYINNYLLSNSQTSSQYTPSQYQDLLVSTYSQQLTELYNLGARKVVVSAVGPLGCIPSQINQRSPSGACVDFINNLVINFNAAVKSSLITLNQQLSGAVFSYANSYEAVKMLIDNPTPYGFTVTNAGCCGVGRLNGQLGCLPIANLCPNRQQHVFWDPFHPTESANLIFAPALLTGNTSMISPLNIQELANLP